MFLVCHIRCHLQSDRTRWSRVYILQITKVIAFQEITFPDVNKGEWQMCHKSRLNGTVLRQSVSLDSLESGIN